MERLSCPYCLSENVEYRPKGPHIGAYCKDCNGFIKWVSKSTIPNPSDTVAPISKLDVETLDLNDDCPPWESNNGFRLLAPTAHNTVIKCNLEIIKLHSCIDMLTAKFLDFADEHDYDVDVMKLICETLNEYNIDYEVK